jgi:hypothetical protein
MLSLSKHAGCLTDLIIWRAGALMLSLSACAKASAGQYVAFVRRSLGEGGSKHAGRLSKAPIAQSTPQWA